MAEPHLKEPNEHADNPHVLLLALVARHSTIGVETHKESNYTDVVSQHHELEIVSYPLACAFISHISVVISQLEGQKIFIFTILLLAYILLKPVVKPIESHIN